MLALRETDIRFAPFLCVVLMTALPAAAAVAADAPQAEEQCPKGAVSEMPDAVRQSSDEQNGTAWFYDRSTTQHANENAFYLYAGKKGCDVWLRLRIQYLSDKPLTVTRVQIKADDKTFDLADPHLKRDSDGKLTWQWYDELVTPDHLLMLFKVTASKSAVLRFIGANRIEERTIPDVEKDGLKNVLGAYHTLGGKL
jgi:hypothetical protein